jgi:hypothetical protein
MTKHRRSQLIDQQNRPGWIAFIDNHGDLRSCTFFQHFLLWHSSWLEYWPSVSTENLYRSGGIISRKSSFWFVVVCLFGVQALLTFLQVPTVFPVVFAALMAQALRAIALRLLERGTTIGQLEQACLPQEP